MGLTLNGIDPRQKVKSLLRVEIEELKIGG
jgi:hypothetical protein